ncbi:MAG: ABC transporter ATP-binding protein [Clostridia bacterium]|nr:ABC transporter ATP-binding protein [Clostridia bacterium]MBR5285168.1 ABC transporter ATP-binding protein [Clostridia bacterium]
MSTKIINLENIHKDYGGKVVLDNLNLYVRDKEFVTLLGPSGCGKTTTLRIIGGFETPSAGVVYFDGVKVNDVPPNKRPVNTVFQRYALFNHLNVFDNVAFGLRIQKVKESEIKDRVNRMLKLVSLPDYGERMSNELSGGEQQRVAIARALVNHPRVLLLDEPLAALDLKLRKEMQRELKAIQQQVGITFVFVTHDQEEALTMSDTIVVMNKGKIQQIGTPTDIYNEPKNAFVANFIGESNIVPGVMHHDKLVSFCGRTFDCLDGGFAPDEPVDVVVRPEDFEVVSPEQGQLVGTVKSVLFMGVHYEIMVETEHFTWTVHSINHADVGDRVGLFLTPDDIHIMHKS